MVSDFKFWQYLFQGWEWYHFGIIVTLIIYIWFIYFKFLPWADKHQPKFRLFKKATHDKSTPDAP